MIYLDSLRTANWKYKKSCHLTADSDEELLSFAKQLGLKETWLQTSRSGVKHFDLTEGMRKKALILKEVIYTREELEL